MEDFIHWLEDRIEEAGMLESEAARKAGLDQSTISKSKNAANNRPPTCNTVIKLARAIGLDIAEALWRAGYLTELEYQRTKENLTAEEQECLRMFRKLPEPKRARVAAYIEGLLEGGDNPAMNLAAEERQKYG